MSHIVLNGVNSNTVAGLLISSLPPISKPMIRTQIDLIDGRDGDIVTKLGYSAYDKVMEIGLRGTFDINEVIAYFDSEGTVIFSDEPDKYYRYQILEQIDFERLLRFRTAKVTFHVQPFKYPVNEATFDDTTNDKVVSGAIAKFPDGISGGTISGLKVNIEPIQTGEGDPSLSNIRPISGRTSLVVVRSGMNMLNVSNVDKTTNGITFDLNQNDDYVVVSGKSNSTNSFANLNYAANTVVYPPVDCVAAILCDREQVGGIRLQSLVNGELTTAPYASGKQWSIRSFTPRRGYYNSSRLQVPNSGTEIPQTTIYPMVVLADTPRPFNFEPYDGVRQTVNLSAAGTVYGGVLDALTGVLTVTHGYIASYAGETLPAEWISDRDVYSPNSTPTTGAQVVYRLAEADYTTYQLTAITLTQRAGLNIIWATSGDVEVTYPYKAAVVVNEGNTYSMPTITVRGSGDITLALNGMDALQIALGNTGYITLNVEEMNAYQGSLFANRLVTGDYNNLRFKAGENILRFTGTVTEIEISNYSRWL